MSRSRPEASSGVKVLLEGRPGVGKTTVVLNIVGALRARGIDVCGFTTKEIRERGRRVGFAIEAIGGGSGVLAHVDHPGPPNVGKYGVDLEVLERVAVPSLERPADVLVIDELGKMELHSDALCAAVTASWERYQAVVATVQSGSHPFTDALKARSEVEVVRVTRANRDDVGRRLISTLA